MGSIPRKEFSQADPDDEIDLESLVKKSPAPRVANEKPAKRADIPNPLPPSNASASIDDDAFDLAAIPLNPERKPLSSPTHQTVLNEAESKSQPAQNAQPAALFPPPPLQEMRGERRITDEETEYDHPVYRKRIRILPSFPTLILIIIVSAVASLLTGIILKITAPSLQNKMQEILSIQENTSIKENALEQSVSDLTKEMNAMKKTPNNQRDASVAASRRKRR